MKIRYTYTAVLLAAMYGISTPADAALVAHYKFDETTGLSASDSAGSVANDATWQEAGSAGLSWGTGQVGSAAILTGANGSGRYFATPSIEVGTTSGLTYSFWIMAATTQTDANTGIFATRNSTADRSGGLTSNNQFWGSGWNTNTGGPPADTGARRIRADSTGTIRSSDIYASTVSSPSWVHVAFTWDGSAGATGANPTALYIDGQLDISGTVNAFSLIEGSWFIGADAAFTNRNFAGSLDDLAIWNETLSAIQIEAIYDGGLLGIDAATAVPEPSTSLLGLLGASLLLRRRRS